MPLTQVDFDYIRNLVRERSAIQLDADKAYLAEARLMPLARREGLASVGDLVARLSCRPDPGMQREMVEAMTTNETSFFRDALPFDALRTAVLPGLVTRRAAERRLAIWSAACSTGQEPYSIALLLKEHFPALSGWDVRLIATDLSRPVLDRARQGRFTQMEVNRGLPATLLVKYFQRQGLDWQLRDDVRRMIEFRELNLDGPWGPLPALDVVFLRNVLIYFDAATKKRILAAVRRVLRPDGYLFLGGSETTLNLDDGYERVQLDRFSCYRLRQAIPARAPVAAS